MAEENKPELSVSLVLVEFEQTALLGSKKVREFLTYEGQNKDFFHRAKVGAMAMGAYARLRATLANERTVRLQEQRQKI